MRSLLFRLLAAAIALCAGWAAILHSGDSIRVPTWPIFAFIGAVPAIFALGGQRALARLSPAFKDKDR